MWQRIARHEWRLLRADRALSMVAVVFGCALLYGLWNGLAFTSFQQRSLDRARAEERARFAELTAAATAAEEGRTSPSPFRDPRSPAVVGRGAGARYALLPLAPLAPLAIGQSDLLPSYFRVTTDAKEMMTAATEIENPHRLLAGRFDVSFVIVYLYPLLIVALAYSLLSGEKEEGTLAMVMAQPVPLRTLLVGKLAIRAALFLLVTAIFLAIVVLIGGVRAPSGHASSGDGAVRLALWTLVIVAYGVFWFAASVAVAAFGRGSATNALTLAGVWLTLVVVLPSLVNLLATSLYPVPSRVEMIQAIRVASDEANAQGSRLLARYYEDHPELAGGGAEQAMTDFNSVRLAVSDEVERRVEPEVRRYEVQLARQQSVIDRLRVLSPAILAQDALSDVSGTGSARHRHFVDQVEAFHGAFRGFLAPLVFQRAKLLDHSGLPTFQYREEDTGAMASRVAVSVASIGLAAMVLTLVGLTRLSRFRIAG
jgi:ABC-2 type transport system permease protein